uniref:Uncharacterized protein n=1 Tax=Plectus sambesii TaxID=2011161 RepID=A0A914X2N3_9BILA
MVRTFDAVTADASYFLAALRDFKPPNDENLSVERPAGGFAKSANPAVDEYFRFVARTGRPTFAWSAIRPAFLWKLEATMHEMLAIEAEGIENDEEQLALLGDKLLADLQRRILATAQELIGIPFTFQRLCELLSSPGKHYKRTEKFLRAVEKNINVVTTVTPNGERVTNAGEGIDNTAGAAPKREAEKGLPITRSKYDETPKTEEAVPAESSQQQQQPERVEADSPAPSGSDDSSLKDGDKEDAAKED